MSLLWLDGMDHYSDAQKFSSNMWTASSVGAGAGAAVTGAIGRTSSGMRLSGRVDVNCYIYKTLAPGSTTAIIGGAFKTSAANVNNPMIIFGPGDSTSHQVSLRINADLTISAMRGGVFGTVLGTTSLALSVGNFYYIGLVTTIHPSTGTVTVTINNATALNLTGQNTRNTSNTSWNTLILGSTAANPDATAFNRDYDDLIVMDSVDATATQGAAFNTFPGDCSVVVTMPTGDGNYTQFTPHSSSSHYQNVDENPPTDDTDYNDGVNTNDRDSYTYAIPSTQSILALAMFPYIRQSAAATRTFKEFVRAGGVNYDNSTAVNLGTAYQFYPQIRGVDPSTGLPWAGGSTELGIKVQS